MSWNAIEESIRSQFGENILLWKEHNATRIYADIPPERLLEYAKYLFLSLSARFIIASAVDTPWDKIDILYHFDFPGEPQVFSLRISVPKANPEVDSLANAIKGTFWIEQEIWELFGVQFKKHPDLKHLLLPADWPEGNYPLRRFQ